MSASMFGRYKQWVNEVSYANLSAVEPQEITRERKILFGSIIRILNHIYAMDRVWQCHLLGESHGYTTRNPDSCPTFDELLHLQKEMDDWYVQYTEGLSTADESRRVEFEFIGGNPGSMTASEIVTHAAIHGVYHYGHIGTALREIGADTVTIDLPVFLHQKSK